MLWQLIHTGHQNYMLGLIKGFLEGAQLQLTMETFGKEISWLNYADLTSVWSELPCYNSHSFSVSLTDSL